MVPQAEIPKFVRTQTVLFPIGLYQKFKATWKSISMNSSSCCVKYTSGGNRIVSKKALTEFLHNLTFQALSKENDKLYLNFDNIGILVLDILERLAKKHQQSINVAKILNENIKQELDKTQFELELPAELQIQEDLEMYLKPKKKKTPMAPPR